jgi:membrane-bound serine protease (ClpP class)
MISDAIAYIRGLAELRGRNADWAEEAVREGANLGSTKALEMGVIDLIATDMNDLLTQLQGREVTLESGPRTLNLENVELTYVEPGWRYELLSLITDPNVAYILLMIGLYGLILEFYNPGVGIAGVIGIICLLLAAFALQMLPINYAGLALILVGVSLMVIEAFSPSFGVFGIGGVVAFIAGSVLLMDSELPGYQISLPLIGAFAATSLGLFVFAIGAALRARAGTVVSGIEAMIGQQAEVVEDFTGLGRVHAFGEIWQAQCHAPLHKGQKVRITSIDGLVLHVEPIKESPS